MDVAEWNIPEQRRKARFIVFLDLATKLRLIHVLKVCDFLRFRFTLSPQTRVVIGAMGGHVDSFHRIGDEKSYGLK